MTASSEAPRPLGETAGEAAGHSADTTLTENQGHQSQVETSRRRSTTLEGPVARVDTQVDLLSRDALLNEGPSDGGLESHVDSTLPSSSAETPDNEHDGHRGSGAPSPLLRSSRLEDLMRTQDDSAEATAALEGDRDTLLEREGPAGFDRVSSLDQAPEPKQESALEDMPDFDQDAGAKRLSEAHQLSGLDQAAGLDRQFSPDALGHHSDPSGLDQEEMTVELTEDDLDARIEENLLRTGEIQQAEPVPPPTPARSSLPDLARSPGATSQPPPPPEAALIAAKLERHIKPWSLDFFEHDYLRTVWPQSERAVERQCDFLERQLGLEPGASILDAGCGLGLQGIALSRRGYRVVGLDIAATLLARASTEAGYQGVEVRFVNMDYRQLSFQNAFDAIVCLNASFGYFDDDENAKIIGNFREALKPGGKLLVDFLNRDHVLGMLPHLRWYEGADCMCIEEASIDYLSSRLTVHRSIVEPDGTQHECGYNLRLYSLHEVYNLLQAQNLTPLTISGDIATPGVFLGTSSPQIIALSEVGLEAD